MIVRLNHEDAGTLANFLVDVTRLSTPKSYRQPVIRLLNDAKSSQIDSNRFLFVYPVLQSAHTLYANQVARIFGWKRIAKWKRVLLVPGLVEYLVKVRPPMMKYRKQLNRVAAICRELKAKCEGVQSNVRGVTNE